MFPVGHSDVTSSGHGSPGGSEPMALGSPSSSGSPTPSGAQYLPGYLMGESSSGIAPSTSRLWSSPPKQRSSSSLSPPSPSAIHVPSKSNLAHLQPSTRSYLSRQPGDKPGGPPVQSLHDGATSPLSIYQDRRTLDRTKDGTISGGLGSGHFQVNGVLTPSKLLNQSSKSFMSPAQIDPFYTQGENLSPDMRLDETWVTVFGFPPTASSYILQQFSQYGTITEHKVSPSGNWMHIHYQSKLQAKKALSKNGKVFGGTIMVGVKPCIEKEAVVSTPGKENLLHSSTSLLKASTSSDTPTLDKSARLANIRPLTQAYKAAISDHEVTPQGNTPQKNNSIVTKAMEYLFNW